MTLLVLRTDFRFGLSTIGTAINGPFWLLFHDIFVKIKDVKKILKTFSYLDVKISINLNSSPLIFSLFFTV